MRLLHAKTFKLNEFIGSSGFGIPEYAILSHTWVAEEVLFKDVCDGLKPGTTDKLGWAKVRFSCAQAVSDGYEYVWIDTCCIDKSSSAELSEAINSMFRWYQDATICYAYLEDIEFESPHFTLIPKSRWFTRGWTLQELIAPRNVRFYDKSWNYIFSREEDDIPRDVISQATGIPNTILRRGSLYTDWKDEVLLSEILNYHSIAQRMSWAANRQTTRVEDRAYSLLGLFGVNIPLLYGEGSRAFVRLQEEIIKSSDDHSIFAFQTPLHSRRASLLAESPDNFRTSFSATLVSRDMPIRQGHHSSMVFYSKYIQVRIPIAPCQVIFMSLYEGEVYARQDHIIGLLSCGTDCHDFLARPAVLLKLVDPATKTYYRIQTDVLLKVPPQSLVGTIALVNKNWQIRSIHCQYDLRKAHIDDIRLLLSRPQNALPKALDSKLANPSLALRVLHPGQMIWVLAYPHDGMRGRGVIPVSQMRQFNPQKRERFDTQTYVRDFQYIPSTPPNPRLKLPLSHLGGEGIICLFLESSKRTLWVVWGRSMTNRQLLWCKILDANAFDRSHMARDFSCAEDIRVWASSNLADHSDIDSLFPKWIWKLVKNNDSAILGGHKESPAVNKSAGHEEVERATTVKAEIRWTDFMGHGMAELEINIVTENDQGEETEIEQQEVSSYDSEDMEEG